MTKDNLAKTTAYKTSGKVARQLSLFREKPVTEFGGSLLNGHRKTKKTAGHQSADTLGP